MSSLIITFDDSGRITSWRYQQNDEYEPGENEIVAENVDHRGIRSKRVDTSVSPPELVDNPPERFDRPGVVDPETRELISEEFLSKGNEAIAARNELQSNANIPPAMNEFIDASLAMQYLTYVALTGDRIESVETMFWG